MASKFRINCLLLRRLPGHPSPVELWRFLYILCARPWLYLLLVSCLWRYHLRPCPRRQKTELSCSSARSWACAQKITTSRSISKPKALKPNVWVLLACSIKTWHSCSGKQLEEKFSMPRSKADDNLPGLGSSSQTQIGCCDCRLGQVKTCY